MKRAFLAVALACAVALASAVSAEAFRCGSRLISFGIGSSEVSEACGAPSWVDSWEENRLIWIYMPLPMVVGSIGTRLKCATVARIKIEEWVYNNGPTQFVSILRFENGRLVDIEMGDYGYQGKVPLPVRGPAVVVGGYLDISTGKERVSLPLFTVKRCCAAPFVRAS